MKPYKFEKKKKSIIFFYKDDDLKQNLIDKFPFYIDIIDNRVTQKIFNNCSNNWVLINHSLNSMGETCDINKVIEEIMNPKSSTEKWHNRVITLDLTEYKPLIMPDKTMRDFDDDYGYRQGEQ